MTSGNRTSLICCVALLFAALPLTDSRAHAANADEIARIVSQIDTPRDTPIPFTEQRTNALLTEPLQLAGEILFTEDGTLVKTITSPFSESIRISARKVEMQRDGKSRRVSLRRRPDMRCELR